MGFEIRSSKALNIPSTSTIETMVNKESVEESSAEENAEISMQDTVLQIISQKSTARVVAQRLRVKHVSLKLCCGPHSCVWYNSRCNDWVELENGKKIQDKWICSTDGEWKDTCDSRCSLNIFVPSMKQMWVAGVKESLIKFRLDHLAEDSIWTKEECFDAERLLTVDDATELDQRPSLFLNQWWQEDLGQKCTRNMKQMWVGEVKESLIKFRLDHLAEDSIWTKETAATRWALKMKIFWFSWDRGVFWCREASHCGWCNWTWSETFFIPQSMVTRGPVTEVHKKTMKLWRHTVWGTNEIVEDKDESCINVK